jgi:hypothetical protein
MTPAVLAPSSPTTSARPRPRRSAVLLSHVEPALREALVASAEVNGRSLSAEIRHALRTQLSELEPSS